MEKELLILKRRKAKEYYKKGWSIRKIAHYLHSGKSNVSKWTKLNDKEICIDNRGWKKGRPRKYTIKQKEEIKKIRYELEKEDSYFIGSKVVKHNYENQTKENISTSFVDRTLKEARMVKSPQKKRKGLSKYMKYPKRTLAKLGKSMMSIDFIGPRYLKGSPKGVSFLSCKYIRPEKHGIVRRINGQTTQQTIKVLKDVWKNNPLPDVVKIDNDSAFGTNLSHDECIGKLALFFLNLGITPLYIAPRSPWNNGENEGFNSVFSRKFWNRLQFTDEDEIDIKIKDFNIAYEKYSKLIFNNPKNNAAKYIDDYNDVDLENNHVKKFKTQVIHFLRIVRRKGEKGSNEEYGFINILNKEMKIQKDLINLFVFCTLDLNSQKLIISSEMDDGLLKDIKSIKFKIRNIIYD
jgi:hypothetical protein